jgi:hypothetical protein
MTQFRGARCQCAGSTWTAAMFACRTEARAGEVSKATMASIARVLDLSRMSGFVCS